MTSLGNRNDCEPPTVARGARDARRYGCTTNGRTEHALRTSRELPSISRLDVVLLIDSADSDTASGASTVTSVAAERSWVPAAVAVHPPRAVQVCKRSNEKRQ
jgi:hypothetical protein